MNTKPFLVTGSAYFKTSTRLVLPALAMAPSDFSRMVVRPPALLPGLGLAFISAPSRSVYSSHQRISATSFSPTSRLTMLGAIGLRRLRQDHGAAVAHQPSLAVHNPHKPETP